MVSSIQLLKYSKYLDNILSTERYKLNRHNFNTVYEGFTLEKLPYYASNINRKDVTDYFIHIECKCARTTFTSNIPLSVSESVKCDACPLIGKRYCFRWIILDELRYHSKYSNLFEIQNESEITNEEREMFVEFKNMMKELVNVMDEIILNEQH